MPIKSDMRGLEQFIDGIKLRFDDPSLARKLGEELSKDIRNAFVSSGLKSHSGATLKALSFVGEPEKTGNGWKVVVGDRDAIGSSNTPAPRHTLRRFYDYLEGTGRVHRYTDWWGMSRSNKRLLEEMRRAGLMGGRGRWYANYMWVQNYGNATAKIRARHFLESGTAKFRARTRDIINTWWKSAGHIGTLKVRVD